VYIVYIHPSFPEVFAEFPELKLLTRVRILMPLYEIYKVEAPRSRSIRDTQGK
jgi:hypothetical protein